MTEVLPGPLDTWRQEETTIKLSMMARAFSILGLALSLGVLAGAAPATDQRLSPPISCANGLIGGINCVPTKKDLKQSREAFERGVKLHNRQRLEEAFVKFDEASRLDPQNVEYLRAREALKANLVFQHMQRGNLLLKQSDALRAAEEFRAALELDSGNSFARERLQEATSATQPLLNTVTPIPLAESTEIRLQPTDRRATFHFTGDVRTLFTELASAYSMKVQFDESVQQRQVVFNVDNVDFVTALRLACKVSKTMWAALDSTQLLIASDTPANHKQYDRMLLQTFLLPAHSTPQEATDLVTTMRNMFELRFVSSGHTANTVEVRGPAPAVKACAKLLQQLSNVRPQVMFDIRVFQISHQLTRDIGVHIPNTFNLYNIPTAALAGLAGKNIQDLINQLISSGGINQLGNTALSGLLAQLGGQQNSIFSQPLATFGGGLTFMGLSLDQLSAALSLNESWVRSLENMSIRAAQGTDASFHLGERFPILNASYAPIFNSPQIANVLGNQSYIPPFPSVSYEDLGLNVKATPTVHGDGSITVKLEMQVRSLTGQSDNGVPVISNREYKGSITLKDGEPAFVAGEVSRTDTLSMSGIPGLGAIPGLNQALLTNSKQENEDELMIAITPHVLSNFERTTPPIYVSER